MCVWHKLKRFSRFALWHKVCQWIPCSDHKLLLTRSISFIRLAISFTLQKSQQWYSFVQTISLNKQKKNWSIVNLCLPRTSLSAEIHNWINNPVDFFPEGSRAMLTSGLTYKNLCSNLFDRTTVKKVWEPLGSPILVWLIKETTWKYKFTSTAGAQRERL